MKTGINHFLLAGLFGLILLATACGAPGDQARWPRLRLLVAAEAAPYAAGLDGALGQYAQRMGTRVELTTAPAARMPALLEAPAPPDVAIACDPALVETLRAQGLVAPPRWVLEQTRDRLALVARPEAKLALNKLEELARPEAGAAGMIEVNRPTGSMTWNLLQARGLRERLGGRLRQFKDAAALEAALGSGEVAVGFMRESRLAEAGAEKFKVLLRVDPLAGKQPPCLVLLVNGRSARPAAAHQLWGYLEAWARNPTFFLRPRPGSGNAIALPAERE